jgi:molybdopterin-guanine dinucleotide biosynthesis protein A
VKRYDNVSLGILAGGRGSRLNGADKAFALFENETLSQRILNQLDIGFSDRLISARSLDERFAEMDLKPVLDSRASFSGPLAGIEALVNACTSDFLLTIPVDIKRLPIELIKQWLDEPELPGIVLQDKNGLQPLLALWHIESVKSAIADAMDKHQTAVHAFIGKQNFKIITRTDIQIGNLNTPQDFESP